MIIRDFEDIINSSKVDYMDKKLKHLREAYDKLLTNLEKEDIYDPPNSVDKLPKHILKCPIHRWRAESGIELVHEEPTYNEFKRICRNWELMSDKQKSISDKKALEFFGKTNREMMKYLEPIMRKKMDIGEAYNNYLKETIEKYNAIGEVISTSEETLKSFWNWFGNSKMVDSSGRPLVFHHATTEDFDEFDVGRGSGVAGTGIYLTNIKFDNDRYGDKHLNLYVKCLNPLDLSSGDEAINKQAKKMKLVGLFDLRTIPQMREWSKDFRLRMLKLGYDGCYVMPQGGREEEKHLVVYNPNQVKLTSNETFSDSSNMKK